MYNPKIVFWFQRQIIFQTLFWSFQLKSIIPYNPHQDPIKIPQNALVLFHAIPTFGHFFWWHDLPTAYWQLSEFHDTAPPAQSPVRGSSRHVSPGRVGVHRRRNRWSTPSRNLRTGPCEGDQFLETTPDFRHPCVSIKLAIQQNQPLQICIVYLYMYIYNQLASISTIRGFTVTPRASPILGHHSRLGPSLQARQDMATQPSGSGSSGQWHLGQCIVRHSATCTMRHDASGKSGSSGLQQKHRGLMVKKPWMEAQG